MMSVVMGWCVIVRCVVSLARCHRVVVVSVSVVN